MNAPTCFADGHFACGQPTPAQLEELSRNGVQTVINLRAPEEPVEFDEAAEAARLGMRYVSIPIRGPDDLDLARVREFGHALDDARRGGGVLIHCASANRVGALVALDEAINRSQPLPAALAKGRAAGLTALEPAVVALAGREAAKR